MITVLGVPTSIDSMLISNRPLLNVRHVPHPWARNHGKESSTRHLPTPLIPLTAFDPAATALVIPAFPRRSCEDRKPRTLTSSPYGRAAPKARLGDRFPY